MAAVATKRRKKQGAKKPLTRHQRRVRAVDKDPLYNPTVPLGGHQLKRAVRDIVNLELKPKLGALDREASTAERQGAALSGRAGDYFRQLAVEEQGNVARQQALSSSLRSNLAGIASESQGQVDEAVAGESKRLAGDAAVRGEGLAGGAGNVQAELAAQRVRSAESGQAYRSAGELQGAASESLAGNTAAATGLRGGELQGELANRLATTLGDVRSRKSEVEGLRGEATSKVLGDMRQGQFENLAVMEGLGIKRQDLAAQILDQRARRKLTAKQLAEAKRHNLAGEDVARGNLLLGQGNLTERQRHNLESEQNAADRNKDKGKLTPTQVRARRRDIERAVGGVSTGTFETKDGRQIPLTTLLKRDPGKWEPKIHAQLQAKYGRKVADEAMRRLRGSTRQMLRDAIGNLTDLGI